MLRDVGVRVSPSAQYISLITSFEDKLEHTIKAISSCVKEIHINVEKQEFQPFYSKAYSEAAPKIEIKGFRKGKVPPKMITQLFGSQIQQDAELNCANEFFNQITKNNKILVLSRPSITDVKKENDLYTFVINFETMPEFELGDYKSLTVKEPIYKVKDEDIEHELLHISYNNGKEQPADTVKGDNYYVTLQYLGNENAPAQELTDEEDKNPSIQKVFLHDHHLPKDFAAAFLNTKVGDNVKYKEAESLPEISYLVKEISEMIPFEFTEENIKLITKDKFDNIEDFKQEIGFKIQEVYDNKSREMMEEAIIEQLVDMHDIEIPQEFYQTSLHKYTVEFYKENSKLDVTDEMFAKNYDFFAKSFKEPVTKIAKWSFISEKIANKEKIEVEEQDIDEFIDLFVSQNPNFDNPQIRQMLKTNDKVKEDVYRKKIIDLLMDFSTTEAIDYNEYLEELRTKQIAKVDSTITKEEITEAEETAEATDTTKD